MIISCHIIINLHFLHIVVIIKCTHELIYIDFWYIYIIILNLIQRLYQRLKHVET